jgi:HTH-type transcriptional regulator / antitoxin HipB
MENRYKTVSHADLLNECIGLPGTKERDKFDTKVQSAVIAYQLKQFRQQKKLTQQQLADKVGIDVTQISKIEKGTRNLTIETIARIVNALGGTFNLNIQAV